MDNADGGAIGRAASRHHHDGRTETFWSYNRACDFRIRVGLGRRIMWRHPSSMQVKVLEALHKYTEVIS